MGCGSRAWMALMRRNLLYRRTYWFSTILEIILPPLFVLILVFIKNAVDNAGGLESETVAAQYTNFTLTPMSFNDYITAMQAERKCKLNEIAGTNDMYDITGILSNGDNWQVPFVKCDSRKCDRYFDATGMSAEGLDAIPFCEFAILALAGSNGDGRQRALNFEQWIYDTYPKINPNNPNKAALPFNFSLVKIFESNDDIDKYVQSTDYGRSEFPKIAMAVVFDSNDPNEFNYTLRQNSTNFNAPEDEARPTARTTPDTSTLLNSFARNDYSTCTDENGSPLQGLYGFSCTGQYLYNGVLTMQRLVNDFIIDASGAAAAGYNISEAGVQFTFFPSKEYEQGGFYAAIGDFAPILVMLGLLYPISSMISYLCKEKELRQKELLKMMSVSESDLGGSWFCTFVMVHLISSIISAIFSGILFERSNGLLLWIFWILTMISLTCFCMAISSITSKPIRGVLIGLITTFGGVILSLALDVTTQSLSLTQLVSLLPIVPFSYGLGQIGLLEDVAIGLTADSISFTENPSGYAFDNTLGSLMFNCVFWGILSWYFNRVIKPDYGQALPFYFPFTATYWCPGIVHAPVSEISVSEKVTRTGIPYEDVSDALKRQADEGKSIEIHDLRKTFGEKSAVDGLNLSMYSGQITALLGHNGAGKTTTINMLTGAMAPTEGYATVAGKDIRTDLKSIRQDIGICLQHDCLFPDLTVREHLLFFARLKGIYSKMTKAEADEHIDQAIRDVALFEKRNTLSKRLSGGQKRKLSVAIAFCGGSKVVLLDEPTSGMDPFSRRFTWNVIRQYRQDRCIILTTHFMDEADILGDRIAIMAEGQLRCAGSSLFLKKMYGVGYQLTIEKQQRGKEMMIEAAALETDKSTESSEVFADSENDATKERKIYDVDEDVDLTEDNADDPMYDDNGNGMYGTILNKQIKTAVAEATLLNDVGTEIRYQIPINASEKFAALFEELDREVDTGKIVSYGVSITTLEEVFLLVARGDSTPESKAKLASSKILNDNKLITITEDEKSNRSRMDLDNEALFTRHLNALLKKRALNFQRDKKAWVCTTILPIVVVTLGFILFLLVSPSRNLSPITLDIAALNADVTTNPINPIPVNSPGGAYVCQPGICTYEFLINEPSTSESYTFCGALGNLNGAAADADADASFRSCTVDLSTDILQTINGVGGAEVVETAVEDILTSSRSLYASSEIYAATQYGAIWYTRGPDSTLVTDSSNFVNESIAQCSQITQSGIINYTSPDDCVRFRGYGYVVQYNFTALHAAPLFQAVADEALIRYATGSLSMTISATIAPLPITSLEEGFGASEDLVLVWFLIMFVFPFIAGSFASFVVFERESKAKHLQTVAGVEPSAYWISTFLWDTMNYQLPLWTIVALMFLFKVDALTTTDRNSLSGVIAALFLFGPASAGYSYCISFLFTSPSLCFIFLVVSNIIIGFGGPLTIFILIIIDQENPNGNLGNVANVLTWFLRPFPSFCFGKSLFFVINKDFIAFIEGDSENSLSVWSAPFLLVDVIFLVVEIIGYTTLAIYLDKWSSNPRIMGRFNACWSAFCCMRGSAGPDITTALPEDEDVLAEQDRVLSGGANADLIVLSQLSKTYSNGKKAVNNLSLGIPNGECFGLLGINGAGKTTTMQMLTAEFPPSSGDATLAGFSISNEPQKTRRRIGYCPQFDAHFAALTGRNHVELYASIKGIPSEFVKEAAAAKLREVGLNDYDSDRLCVNYSGGMKRRLSLACATIGQPQIIFLDECSTGVDPVARREIWQMVSDMVSTGNESERASVILTTHSMEECEALCPRIGIMANGRLRCLGSAQHLKNKFGQGYQVELKTKIADRHDEDFIQNANVLTSSILGAEADVEAALAAPTEMYFNESQCKEALHRLTNDEYLSGSIIGDPHAAGYSVWRDANSPVGVTLDTLTTFATIELRMRNISNFIAERFPVYRLRERQDTKARYEVSAEGLRISAIFAAIESKKEELRLSDYGVSQTSLEQVFNMHAAEAEKLKQGRDDH